LTAPARDNDAASVFKRESKEEEEEEAEQEEEEGEKARETFPDPA